jgi:hypothetical protein
VPDFVTAIDVSSHQPNDLGGIIDIHQPAHVVVRMYLPEEKPPQQTSIDQVDSARAKGCTVGAYVWAYRSLKPRKTIQDAIALAKQCGMDPPPVLWIDCETYVPDGVHVEDPGPDEAWLLEAVDECKQLNVRAGIYTGSWWWNAGIYMNGSRRFTDLPLWTSQPDLVPDLSSAAPYSGWKSAGAKQYDTRKLDFDVFDVACTEVPNGGPVQPPRTIEDIEAENPNIREQLRRKQMLQVLDGQDPFDYAAFRQFLADIHAPDTGDMEFIGFRRPTIDQLAAANPNLPAQLVTWQDLRKARGEDPQDYSAFRHFLLDISAPDTGPLEFLGFQRFDIGELEHRNRNIRSQLVGWRALQTTAGLDPLAYPVFRKHEIDIGAPDTGPWEFWGFR